MNEQSQETQVAETAQQEKLPPELKELMEETVALAELFAAASTRNNDDDMKQALSLNEFMKLSLQKDADSRLN